MWMLVNLKKFGANEDDLVGAYMQQIRNISEFSCPVWNAGLTLHEIKSLERIQKTALVIIRGNQYSSYSEALQHFKLDSLESRREKLCLKFAIKAYKHNKFSSWFSLNSSVPTRSGQSGLPLKKVIAKKRKYRKSPLPYLTE